MRAPRSEAQSGRSGPHGLPCPGPEAGHGPAGGQRARGEADSRAAGPRSPPYKHLIIPSLPPPPRHDDPSGETEAPSPVSPVSTGEAARVQEESVSSGPGAGGSSAWRSACTWPGASLHPHLPAGAPLPPGVAHTPWSGTALPGGPQGDWSSPPPPSLSPTDAAALRTCGPGLKRLLHTLQP
ncbi:unnamed protein product [Nyctereutes procyonoides]|uniref:(raccoon dog) hypothetical protein n=1 Tax=Nyctereutes procyonoides TaxID=34880 RepID=A0A811YZP7_NYCPR|nr:unnamed protein product [Nyctereutes procyonoides]